MIPAMLASFAWGFVAASSLMVGGAFALQFRVSRRMLGMVMAFGSGVLISAVAFELVQEAFNKAGGGGSVAIGLAVGSVTFSQAIRSSTAWAVPTASAQVDDRLKARHLR
jgi:ZIP family zinc transporter